MLQSAAQTGKNTMEQCHASQLTGFVLPALLPYCLCDIDNDECRENSFSQHLCCSHYILEHIWSFCLGAIAVILMCRSKVGFK